MAKEFEEVHKLVEEFSGEMTLKEICEQEGVSYRGYISWRQSHGLSRPRRPQVREKMIPVEITDSPGTGAKAVRVHIEFENGLCIDRAEMEVDTLIRFLTHIQPVLCLD